jgi:hypothetical protein
MRKPDRPKSGVVFRCAIYTRKSSDDGLEQEFPSIKIQPKPSTSAHLNCRRQRFIAVCPASAGRAASTFERRLTPAVR